MNLGSNAADAMPEGGKLSIKTFNLSLDARQYPGLEAGDYVCMLVSDTGQGMDEHSRKHIFDPFYTTKEKGRGTGLGLSSVYGIVKAHNGHIECVSRPGEETMFRIYWPALPGANVLEDICQPEASTRQGGETILVVDDEPEILDLTAEMLQSSGYVAWAAKSGEEALEMLSRRETDVELVILDLNMPGMGGFKCLEEVLRIDPEAKVLIASGYSSEGQARESLARGARGYIAKPYTFQELMSEIGNILDGAGAGQ